MIYEVQIWSPKPTWTKSIYIYIVYQKTKLVIVIV